jgi:microcystin-dependent protein
MADPFVAEIRLFPFNFPPKGWAFCNGQLMPISQNTALFSLLGTMYGGDGKSTFGLPDLRGRVPVMAGQGQGLSLYDQGQTGGVETVTLLQSEVPAHTHTARGSPDPADLQGPSPARSLARSTGAFIYHDNTAANLVQAGPSSLAPAGASLPHDNLAPYLALNFCIALQGVFPPRS